MDQWAVADNSPLAPSSSLAASPSSSPPERKRGDEGTSALRKLVLERLKEKRRRRTKRRRQMYQHSQSRRPSILDPQASPSPETLNLKPETLNPKELDNENPCFCTRKKPETLNRAACDAQASHIR